jgi:hypothetical protein
MEAVYPFEMSLYNLSPHNYTVYKARRKGKVVPVLFFNSAPRHEGVLGE